MANCEHHIVDYTVHGVVVTKVLMAVHRFTCADCKESARLATRVSDES